VVALVTLWTLALTTTENCTILSHRFDCRTAFSLGFRAAHVLSPTFLLPLRRKDRPREVDAADQPTLLRVLRDRAEATRSLTKGNHDRSYSFWFCRTHGLFGWSRNCAGGGNKINHPRREKRIQERLGQSKRTEPKGGYRSWSVVVEHCPPIEPCAGVGRFQATGHPAKLIYRPSELLRCDDEKGHRVHATSKDIRPVLAACRAAYGKLAPGLTPEDYTPFSLLMFRLIY
jgi:hypothetical protein